MPFDYKLIIFVFFFVLFITNEKSVKIMIANEFQYNKLHNSRSP